MHVFNRRRESRPIGLRRVAWLAIGLAISAVAAIRLLDGIQLDGAWSALRDADYIWLVPALVFLVADLQLRALRWRILLEAGPGVSHRNLFGVSNVGYLVNNLLPFRPGEIARVYLIDELEHTGKVRAAASAVVERVIDVLAMVLLLIAIFPFIDEPAWATGPALALGAVAVAGFAVLLVLSHLSEAGRSSWLAPVGRVPRIGGRLSGITETMLRSLAPLKKTATLAVVTMLTAVIWGCAALSFYMVFVAFGIEGGFAAAALVLTATTLTMVVPSAPGYVGVFHAAAVPALVEVFGVPREQALTYAVAQHALIYFVTTAFGAAFLLTHRGLWQRMLQALRPAKRTPTARPDDSPAPTPAT